MWHDDYFDRGNGRRQGDWEPGWTILGILLLAVMVIIIVFAL